MRGQGRRNWLLAVAAMAIAAAAWWLNGGLAWLIASHQKKNDALLEEQLAYHAGVMAYLYGYPLVDMATQMHNETHRIGADQQVYAPVNRMYHYPAIVGPHNAGNLRAPNNDTLYFSGWFDISAEPLVIHTPDTRGRYYTIAVTNQYAEVAHIGRRTTGTGEGYFALVPPGWKGELPRGVQAIPTETPVGWLLGRMLVDGESDVDAAMALVEDIWTASLSEFVAGQRPPLPQPVDAAALDPLDSLDFFAVMNQQLKKLPARPAEAGLMAQFDQIGVGPNSTFDAATLSSARRKGLQKAISDGSAMVTASTQRTIPDYNGWMISHEIGRYGFNYLARAAVVKGGYGNLPEESLYPAAVFDSEGDVMSGADRFRLHFAAGQLPPVDGFWSLAAYRLADLQFEENTLRRYSIGDRTPGLQYGADGSLTIALQHDDPGPGVNWLPVPAGRFMLVMRLYEPRNAALANDYLLPRIEKLP
jgi:hypothetical protein